MRRTVYQQRGPLQGRAPKEVAACNKSTTMTSWVVIERGPDEPGPSEEEHLLRTPSLRSQSCSFKRAAP